MKYILSWQDSAQNTGGVKAKKDTELFLNEEGFTAIKIPAGRIKKLLYVLFKLPFILMRIRSGVIAVQFPTGTWTILDLITRYVKNLSGAKLVYIIHDIETLRYWSESDNDRKKEIELRLLKRADGIISLNAKMTEWLRSKGVKVPIENMCIWDYDNPQPVREIGEYNRTVGLAGNLDKVQFLKKIPSDINIYVYGPNKESDYPDNVKYVGNFSPDLLPLKFKESFGLVWDGDEINTCSGPLGNYLKYNDPHKLSMYLSSGIPVVIWSKAATAEFVKNVKVGILIDNLNSLNTELNNINEDEYKIMCSNAVNLSKKMRKGYFLKTALQNLIKQL
ncbi:MAG TPA: hypothetical protein K8V14_05155 [Staphylococcus ureilyticus]|uniref:hypothetical protein n=1 Tax=Staphylococcus ureilyticus TaxID=94138 RepID=UPI001DBA593E|nr:hypothetical protein [Staphylococcus ureilyticus]HJG66686.1 hypothetical protein [Staphylococcus ureilyticus]